MARNLLTRISEHDTMTIYDVNQDATRKFIQEIGIITLAGNKANVGKVIEVAKTPRKVAERSVSREDLFVARLYLKMMMIHCSIDDPSRGPSRPSHDSTDSTKSQSSDISHIPHYSHCLSLTYRTTLLVYANTLYQETIITVLPEPSHVQSVMTDIMEQPPLTSTSGQTRLFIDCSTIDPLTSRSIASDMLHSSHGVFVDAPMSGGVVGAQAATLTFMLGAPADMVKRIEATLFMMGRSVHHCGDRGAGLSAKLANNYLLAVMNIATAEAMNLGIKCGLDPKVLARLINASTGRNWCSEANNPVPGVVAGSPASNNYKGASALL